MLNRRVMANPPPFFTWKLEFALGIRGVDAEHERFFEIINELYTAMNDGDGDIQVRMTHRRLMDYAAFHFNAEEAFLSELDYPDIEVQRRQHEWFLGQLANLRHQPRASAFPTLLFARDWLLQHILGTDKQFAVWLFERRRLGKAE
jgi:hemerythrin